MDPKFPVFLKERDGWMILIKSSKDLERIEKFDVEENEYLGWDIEGKRIKLSVQDDEISCFISEEGDFGNELKEAIFYFANMSGPKGTPFTIKENIDFLQMFLDAEINMKSSGLLYRAKNYFLKIIRGRSQSTK